VLFRSRSEVAQLSASFVGLEAQQGSMQSNLAQLSTSCAAVEAQQGVVHSDVAHLMANVVGLEEQQVAAQEVVRELVDKGTQEMHELFDATRHALAEDIQTLESRQGAQLEDLQGGLERLQVSHAKQGHALAQQCRSDRVVALEAENRSLQLIVQRSVGQVEQQAGVFKQVEQHGSALQEVLVELASLKAKYEACASEVGQLNINVATTNESVQTLHEEQPDKLQAANEQLQSCIAAALDAERKAREEACDELQGTLEQVKGMPETVASMQGLLDLLRSEFGEKCASLEKSTAELQHEQDALKVQNMKAHSQLVAACKDDMAQVHDNELAPLQNLMNAHEKVVSLLRAEVEDKVAAWDKSVTDLRSAQESSKEVAMEALQKKALEWQMSHDEMQKTQIELAIELKESKDKFIQHSETLQNVQECITAMEGSVEDRASEATGLRADLHKKHMEWQHMNAGLQREQETHRTDAGEKHANLTSEFEASRSQVAQHRDSLQTLHEQAAALQTLLDERAQEAIALRTDLDSRYADWQYEHRSHSLSSIESQAKLSDDIGSNCDKVEQQRVALEQARCDISELQSGIKSQAEEIQQLRAELGEASNKLGESFQEKVQTLAVRHEAQLEKRADEIQGAVLRCDALTDEISAERRLRMASSDQLAKQFKDELFLVESKQEELLQRGVETCLSHSNGCRQGLDELKDEHKAAVVAHSRELQHMQDEVQQAHEQLKVALQDEVHAVECRHELEIQRRAREIQSNSARCDVLFSELTAEKSDRSITFAEINAEVMVRLNCTQKQSVTEANALREALTLQLDVLKDQALPAVQAEFKVQTEALQVELRSTMELSKVRLDLAEERNLERSRALANQLARAEESTFERERQLSDQMSSERESRLAETMALRESVAVNVADLTIKVKDNISQLEGRLEEHVCQFTGLVEGQGQELALMVTETNDTMQKLSTGFSCQLEEQERQLSGKIDDKGLDLAVKMEEQGRRLTEQGARTCDALQAMICARQDEARALSEELEAIRTSVPLEIRRAVKTSQEQQESQFRMLAEDSDNTSRQIAVQFQHEHEEHERQNHEIRGWSAKCDSLRNEITGLRSLIHTQAAETDRTNKETQAATVRDSFIAPGVVGAACVAAAFLL